MKKIIILISILIIVLTSFSPCFATEESQYITVNQKIRNGNFNDTSFWTHNSGTLQAVDNTLIVTDFQYTNVPRTTTTIFNKIIGHKYYVYLQFESKTVNLLKLQITSVDLIKEIIAPIVNQLYIVSTIFTPTTTNGTSFDITQFFDTGAIAKDQIINIKNVMIFDLTSDFGVGFEPTAEQFLNLLNNNSPLYFEGSKQLLNPNYIAPTIEPASTLNPDTVAIIDSQSYLRNSIFLMTGIISGFLIVILIGMGVKNV